MWDLTEMYDTSLKYSIGLWVIQVATKKIFLPVKVFKHCGSKQSPQIFAVATRPQRLIEGLLHLRSDMYYN